MRRSSAFCLLSLAAAMVLTSRGASAQALPDSFTNLKVLPKDISHPQLLGVMRSFTEALGVRCEFCHVRVEAQPRPRMDFAADDKRTKQTARLMLQMVQHIDREVLTEIPGRREPNVAVNCYTCHRGLERPVTLAQVLADTLATGGTTAVEREYARLRERYYGTGSFDFSEGSLTDLAMDVGQEGKTEDALAILRINEKQFPNSGQVQAAFGQLYAANGDTAQAISRYEKAISLEPRLRRGLERRLQALRGGN